MSSKRQTKSRTKNSKKKVVKVSFVSPKNGASGNGHKSGQMELSVTGMNVFHDVLAQLNKLDGTIVRSPTRKNHSPDEVIRALDKARGFKSLAARMLGITPSGLRKRIRENPDLKDAARDIDDYWLDKVEIKLFELIDSGDVSALKFFLKCKGRRRGWVERLELNANMFGVQADSDEFAQDNMRPPDLHVHFTRQFNINAPDDTKALLPPLKADGTNSIS